MRPGTYAIAAITCLVLLTGTSAHGRQTPSPPPATIHGGHGGHDTGSPADAVHAHGAPVPAVTFAELERTAHQLAAARAATEKYQDVRSAEAEGYRAIGPDVPGMGIHYVRQDTHQPFSVTEPPILLYERDAEGPGGLRLVGVS